MDVSVILPVVNEGANLRILIPKLNALLDRDRLTHEIVVVDGGSSDGTRETAESLGARVVSERRKGYAGALETGFAEARGDYILTLDADQSHDPDFVSKMWRARERGDIVVASRYARGGVAYTTFVRRSTSWLLNSVLRWVLAMPVRDLSSGYRLYRRDALANLDLRSTNFEVLEEILVKAYANGFSIVEVPFTYFPRGEGRSHAKLFSFGWSIARSSVELWKIRNSYASADYDERAFYSSIPMQRFWHRRRHNICVSWARGSGRVLDAGCGSSLIVQSLNNAIGLDSNLGKLRFLRREGMMRRVLRVGGTLIIGTPDYATRGWQMIEPVYGFLMRSRCRDEHLTHYTMEKLKDILLRHGMAVEEAAYVARSELILRCRKIDLKERSRAAVLTSGSNAA